jgi:hypothetical protein
MDFPRFEQEQYAPYNPTILVPSNPFTEFS